MKPIRDAWLCQIEVTNVCPHDCAYCTRYIRHVRHDQRFFMSLDILDQCLQSLIGWPSRIGIIGGEPVLHPWFEAMCDLLLKYNSRDKYQLFTSGGPRYDRLLPTIDRTFKDVALNPHTEHQRQICLHQPITMAVGEVVTDYHLRQKLIDDCWVQRQWCPTITPKGAFFCEVAGALDMILDGPGGWPIRQNWWWRMPPYWEQSDIYCNYCGMPVPMQREIMGKEKENITPRLFDLFQRYRLPGIDPNHADVVDLHLSAEDLERNRTGWFPGAYRQDLGDK